MPDYTQGPKILGAERVIITIPTALETINRFGLPADHTNQPVSRLSAPISGETKQRFGRRTFKKLPVYCDSE